VAFPTEPKCRKCGREFITDEEVFSVAGVPGNNVCWLCATGTREEHKAWVRKCCCPHRKAEK